MNGGSASSTERHERLAQQPAERARHVRAEDRCEPKSSHRDTDTFADLCRRLLDAGEHPPVVAGRVDRARLVGPGERVVGPAVDLDAAADHDGFERAALGGGPEDRRRCVVGERMRRSTTRSRVGLPDRHVQHDVRVEGDERLDHLVVLRRRDAMEHGAVQPEAGRVGVDPDAVRRPTPGLSSRLATSEPSSPPIPLMSTR